MSLNEIPLDYLFTLQVGFWLLVNALDYLKNLHEIPIDQFKSKQSQNKNFKVVESQIFSDYCSFKALICISLIFTDILRVRVSNWLG